MNKIVQKTQRKALYLLLILLVATPLLASNCPNGCIACYGSCAYCFRHKFNEVNGQCLPDKIPDSDNCDVYYINNKCAFCKPGYSESDGACTRQTRIPNCYNGKIFNGQETCKICGNGFYPSLDSSTCVPASQFSGDADQNCEWGTRSFREKLSCIRCKKGYMAVSGYDVCVRSTVNGCLSTRSRTSTSVECRICDGWNGWFMARTTMKGDNKVCTQLPALVGGVGDVESLNLEE